MECIAVDSGIAPSVLRVDGGACQNDFLMQFQADVLGTPVERPAVLEVTALGAAVLAGLGSGFWKQRGELEAAAGSRTLFEPNLPEAERESLYRGWKRAVERSRDWVVD
jgi:glycerol kinase